MRDEKVSGGKRGFLWWWGGLEESAKMTGLEGRMAQGCLLCLLVCSIAVG